jgi:hypothetical protein
VAVLDLSPAVRALAKYLVDRKVVPTKAAADAAHIAVGACNGIDYLLTWNRTHIANAETRRPIEHACADQGYESPVLCTPEELMGEGP